MAQRVDAAERFMLKVREDDAGCWLWTGEVMNSGYGRFYFGGGRFSAHRWSYEHFTGAIPEGMVIDHLCRSRTCVNPQHLESVTQKVNLLRGDTFQARNAAKTECPKGHPYDEANTLIRRQSQGRGFARVCRECEKARHRNYQLSRKVASA